MSTGGFEKRTRTADIRELISHLGRDRADVAGHDIGAMVVFSRTAPDAVRRLALLDAPRAGLPRPAPAARGAGYAVNPGDEPVAPKHLAPKHLWWFAFK